MTSHAASHALVKDEVSFAEWTGPHLRRMSLVAARFGPPGEEEDIVQEALTRAWRSRHRFDEERGPASAWLCAITANVAKSFAQRRRKWWRGIQNAPERIVERDVDLEQAIANLAPRQRLAIECYYAIGLSIPETAAVMQCAEGTVKSTLADARWRLRSMLQSHEVTTDG